MEQMRIAILDTYYAAFLNDFYRDHPEVTTQSVSAHRTALLGTCFGSSDFYSRALNALGCTAEEFVINDERLQLHWAREHRVHVPWQWPMLKRLPKLRYLSQDAWYYRILEAQLEAFEPTVIYCQKISALRPEVLFALKRKFNCLIVGQIASQLPPQDTFAPYDLLISSLPHKVELFRSWGKHSEYLPLAFEPTLLRKLPDLPTTYPVTHIGGYGKIHTERNNILEYAAEHLDIDCWGYGTEYLRPNSSILKRYHGTCWGLDMYSVLAHSKITLTSHIREVAADYANNQTLFEATGSGCLLLTDAKKNLHELFEIGEELDVYTTPQELVEKIQYYLEHENERQRIATAGQARTLRDHTYAVRMKQLQNILSAYV